MGLINDMKVIFQSHNNTKRDRKNPDCWNLTNDMPVLTGKVIIVTGTTSGLGEGISKHLINKGAKVYMLARNTEKGQQYAKDLNQEAEKIEKGRIPGGHSVFVKCDFADLSSVRKAAEEIKQKEEAVS
ncbi:hypothetical protein L7F22_050180 [Adiantum nelumboides]|nr:hypothetical protein [Adiantum nelumboides]